MSKARGALPSGESDRPKPRHAQPGPVEAAKPATTAPLPAASTWRCLEGRPFRPKRARPPRHRAYRSPKAPTGAPTGDAVSRLMLTILGASLSLSAPHLRAPQAPAWPRLKPMKSASADLARPDSRPPSLDGSANAAPPGASGRTRMLPFGLPARPLRKRGLNIPLQNDPARGLTPRLALPRRLAGTLRFLTRPEQGPPEEANNRPRPHILPRPGGTRSFCAAG